MSEWIKPDGINQPVPDHVVVDARLADGMTVTTPAGALVWTHGDVWCEDIIQYRVVEE